MKLAHVLFAMVLCIASFRAGAQASDPRLHGLSTRGPVYTVDNVLIAGFIVTGSAPKTVYLAARGTSLLVDGALADPVLELYSGTTLLDSNDNWIDSPNFQLMLQTGFHPPSSQESAIITTLAPGAYTAIVRGSGNATGIGIVEIYEYADPSVPLTGLSARGQVQDGDRVMVGGFDIQGTTSMTVVIRARGPSLADQGVPNPLPDPAIRIFSGSTQILFNDNWQDDVLMAPAISASGYAPTSPLEAAAILTLAPGPYTVVVTGQGGGTGVGIVEVFRP